MYEHLDVWYASDKSHYRSYRSNRKTFKAKKMRLVFLFLTVLMCAGCAEMFVPPQNRTAYRLEIETKCSACRECRKQASETTFLKTGDIDFSVQESKSICAQERTECINAVIRFQTSTAGIQSQIQATDSAMDDAIKHHIKKREYGLEKPLDRMPDQ